MQVISDVAGMEVRGMSSNTQSTSLSVFSAVMFDPLTGSVFQLSSNGFGRTTDENAGLNATSSSNATSAAGLGMTFVATVNAFSATVSNFSANGLGIATSP